MRGGETRARAVFLDRDGVLNALRPDPESGLAESPLSVGDVHLLPGVASAIARLTANGYVLIGVTNQPAAAKGKIPRTTVAAIQARVIELLADAGSSLDGWRICLHHPEGTDPDLSGPCDCRKPAPGMLLDAAAEYGIDLAASWTIGDASSDVAAGRAAGTRTVLVEHPPSAHKRHLDDAPDLRADDLMTAVTLLLGAGPY
jgi:D-glycero-D-manno-heptose 1,7-bisphosphate phosphatase